jgi:pyruvate/2-oxoglutarate dehydrogenase complex dihydrolipoamide acyltransferase (E2) component
MTSLVEFRLPEDDPMVEVMTDKATVTIGAPCEGRIEAIAHEVGSVVPVGEVLVRIQSTDTHESTHESKHQETDAPIKATAVGSLEESLPGAGLFERPVTAVAGALAGSNGGLRSSAPASPIRYFRAKPLATPATRRMAKELGLDLRRIVPSGEGGRVTREDLRAALGQAPEQSVAAGRVSAVSGEAREERVPILGMRRQIAERMHRSKSQAAHFTFVEECDASRLVELRARLEPEAERRGVQLSYLPFIVKAVLQALAAHPVLNSAVDDEARELVYKKYYNIGIATATDAGLMVPVIRGADRMRLFELAREISRLAEAARQGSLRPEELRGGSFTITSLGKRSGLLATPILNYPEVGILGVHRIKDKPVVRDGQIVVGQIMLLSLSFDHRIVDGHVGAEFAYEVIDYLENPEKLFYESL